MAKNYSQQKGRRANRPFKQLYDDMIKSKAFRHLNGNELKVLIYFISQYNGANNGMLDLAYSKAKEQLNITEPTLNKSLKSLEDKGFIKNSLQGCKGILSRYALTCYPVDECLNAQGLKLHTLPVSETATNEWREFNKTLINLK